MMQKDSEKKNSGSELKEGGFSELLEMVIKERRETSATCFETEGKGYIQGSEDGNMKREWFSLKKLKARKNR
jgi:hypothetical protein